MSELKKIMNGLIKKTPHIIKDAKIAGRINRIVLDSPQLNFLFSGGLPIGRIHNFFGMESQGKSTLAIFLCGQLQKKLNSDKQKYVLYLDYERSFDKDFAEKLGLNTDEEHFIYATPNTLEEGIDLSSKLIETGELLALVLDSDAAAPTNTQMVDEFGKATFGALARILAEGLRKLNILCANYNTTFFTISQERANMAMMSHLNSQTGGFASKFYPTTRNRIKKVDVIKNAYDTIGISLKVQNYKNKGGIPFRIAMLNLYYGPNENNIKGFDVDSEYLDFIISLGIVKQSGAFFAVPDEEKKLQGRVKLQTWLEEHPDKYIKFKQQVDEMLVNTTILDENNKEISEDFDPSQEEINEDILEDMAGDNSENRESEEV
jgi:recombination protein RecA